VAGVIEPLVCTLFVRADEYLSLDLPDNRGICGRLRQLRCNTVSLKKLDMSIAGKQ